MRQRRGERSLLVSATADQSDPIGPVNKFLLRVSSRMDVRDAVLMSYLVYFRESQSAVRMRSVAGQAGWRATMFAVPEAFVVRLTRRRMLFDGLINAEREQVLKFSESYAGEWRYVLVEQGERGTWDELAEQIAEQAPASPAVPPQRRPPDSASSTRPSHGAVG